MKRFKDSVTGKFFMVKNGTTFYISVESAEAFLADKEWATSIHLMSNGEYYKYMPNLEEC
jgi:hypothetical protein